jgi:hypothetical protein
VSRREILTRAALGGAAFVCFVLAVVLVLLTVDVARWHDAMRTGDVRYGASTETMPLWRADSLVPFNPAKALLDIQDDIEVREALRALRLARLGDPVISDPELAIRRNEAQARLEAIVAAGRDDATRSRAAGLLGALGLARFVYETQDREALLSSTVSSLKLALDLDPTNDEAKYNLEFAYQRGRGIQLSEAAAGTNPSPGGLGSQGAGAGTPGSGY